MQQAAVATPIMAAKSRFRYWADRLAVESEPGLTASQLMVRLPFLCLSVFA